jgi:hypothetical protein
VLLSVFLAALRWEQLAGDPGIYRDRMTFLFDGEVPYVDFFFEHPPMAIVPMAIAWLLGGAFDILAYTVVFAVQMAATLYVTMRKVEGLAVSLVVESAGVRWLVVAGFLFPIVLFRYDPVPTLLSMLAVVAFVGGRDKAGVWWATSGILTKGWPAVLALAEWWRGRRLRAVVLAILAVATLGGLAALPGFLQARTFDGIHSETLVGGLMTLIRNRTGSSLQLITDAGATYVAVPSWAVVVNLIIGLVVLAIALYGARGEFAWPKGIRLLAAATLAILIGSPLLSPQFLLWPTPFLALHSSVAVRRLGIAATALTLLYMLGWNPGFRGDLWWVGVMNLRNLVLIALGMVAALSVGDRPVARPTVAAS